MKSRLESLEFRLRWECSRSVACSRSPFGERQRAGTGLVAFPAGGLCQLRTSRLRTHRCSGTPHAAGVQRRIHSLGGWTAGCRTRSARSIIRRCGRVARYTDQIAWVEIRGSPAGHTKGPAPDRCTCGCFTKKVQRSRKRGRGEGRSEAEIQHLRRFSFRSTGHGICL